MTSRSLLVSLSVVVAVTSVIVRPSGVSAQSLHLAELFAEQGRTDDARAEVLAWFEIRGAEATPTEVQHGLWLRGRFAQDPAAGLADLDRLVEEYPQGPYTGLALGWLASAAAEAGDDARAAALFTRVAQSHPDTDAGAAARDWLRQRGIRVESPVAAPAPRVEPPPRVEPAPARQDSVTPPPARQDSVAPPPARQDSVPPPAPRPPARADSVMAPPATPPDSAAMVADSADSAVTPADSADVPVPADSAASAPVERPAAAPPAEVTAPPTEVSVAPPPADPEPAPERIPPGPPVPGAATAGPFAVQIGAFRNPIGAGGLVDELITAGFDARLVQVPINDLLRVRIGRFATLEDAQAELERLRAAGRDGAVVNDARRETQVR